MGEHLSMLESRSSVALWPALRLPPRAPPRAPPRLFRCEDLYLDRAASFTVPSISSSLQNAVLKLWGPVGDRWRRGGGLMELAP